MNPNLIVFSMLVYTVSIFCSEIDYSKANKNSKIYDQVPTNQLIWGKYQAFEPLYIFEGHLKGRGFMEPNVNLLINKIRESGISVYVDYFTTAKKAFYRRNNGYEMCGTTNRKFTFYKNLKSNELKLKNGKYNIYSIPFGIRSPIGNFAIATSKLDSISQYKFPGYNVYNSVAILNDPDLYTAHMKDNISSEISIEIYDNFDGENILKKKYKKRIYEFVLSNQDQFAMMLRGKRMHWACPRSVAEGVDLNLFGNFYLQKLGIDSKTISYLEYAPISPHLLKLEDYKLSFVNCFGSDPIKLKKIITIINKHLKKTRANEVFWTQILKNYTKDFNVIYEPPDQFYMTKDTFKLKDKLINGYFD